MANNLYVRVSGDTFKLVGPHETTAEAREVGMALVGYGNYYLENETENHKTKKRNKETLKSQRITADELNELFKTL